MLASQVASKGYFAGEVTGFRFGRSDCKTFSLRSSVPVTHLTLVSQPPNVLAMTDFVPGDELERLKQRVTNVIQEIREKKHTMPVKELKRLLFRCAATLIFVDKVRCRVNLFEPITKYIPS